VVDVRMREDDVVDRLGIDRQRAVLLERLLAVALVEPAVEQDPLAVRLDEMHRSRRGLRRSVESDSHAEIISNPGRARQPDFVRTHYAPRTFGPLKRLRGGGGWGEHARRDSRVAGNQPTRAFGEVSPD